MEEFIKELGKAFLKARNENKWSLNQVKIKIEAIPPKKEFSISEIGRVERGERKDPNPALLARLCKIYKMDVVSIFRRLGYLYDDNLDNLVLYDKEDYISIFDNIVDAMDFSGFKNEKFSLLDKEIMENPLNLVRVFIKNEDVPNELFDTVWVLIDRGVEVSDGEIGVFLYQDKYLIKKKVISTDGGITLIGKDNKITVIRNTAQYKELGKIIKGLKSF